jgi:FkbM family methyltransferase
MVSRFYKSLRILKFGSTRSAIASYFPNLYEKFTSIPVLQRIYVYQITKSNLNLLFWIYFILTGRHVSKNGFALSNYGVWLATRPNDATYAFCLDAKYGNRLEHLLHSICDKTIFIDVGANIGVFSLVAGQNPNISAIHSFEPDSENYEYLVKNIERNESFRTIPHKHALSESIGEARLSRTLGHSGASTILSDDSNLLIPSTRISIVNHEYLNSILNSTSEKYFVKIDVEGHELEVLKALKNAVIFPLIQDFFVEFDNGFGRVKEVENFLLENEFVECNRWGKDSHWDSHWARK